MCGPEGLEVVSKTDVTTLPKDVKETVSECRAAGQEELGKRQSGMEEGRGGGGEDGGYEDYVEAGVESVSMCCSCRYC